MGPTILDYKILVNNTEYIKMSSKLATHLRGLARYWPHIVATRLNFLDI